MHRSFVHLELNVDDTARAREFYRDLFGWDIVDVPMGDVAYTQIKPPTGPAGGIQTKTSPGAPSAWVPYVGVASVEDTLRRALAAGARVMTDYTVVPGYGALAIIVDPTGVWLGLWEVAEPEELVDLSDDADADAELAPAESESPRQKKAAKKKAAKKKATKKTPTKKAAKKKAAKKKATKKKATKKTPTKKTPTKKKATKKKATKKEATKKKAAKKKTAKKKTTKKGRR